MTNIESYPPLEYRTHIIGDKKTTYFDKYIKDEDDDNIEERVNNIYKQYDNKTTKKTVSTNKLFEYISEYFMLASKLYMDENPIMNTKNDCCNPIVCCSVVFNKKNAKEYIVDEMFYYIVKLFNEITYYEDIAEKKLKARFYITEEMNRRKVMLTIMFEKY